MSKQAFEGHRKRMGCQRWKLPSDRAPSKYHGLEPTASHQLKRKSNTAAVTKYRRTLEGHRAVFCSRHMAKYRIMALSAVPAPSMPKVLNYTEPPLSWLIVGAELLPCKALEILDRGEIVLSHKTWLVRFHPDKIKVCAQDLQFLLTVGKDSTANCRKSCTSFRIGVHHQVG
jgi:hypothetical protein